MAGPAPQNLAQVNPPVAAPPANPVTVPPIDPPPPAAATAPLAAPPVAEAAPAIQPQVTWTCTSEKAGENEAAAGPFDKPLTVGEKFVLTCEGQSVSLAKDKLKLNLPKEEKYSLRLLRVQELTDNKGVFTATSYKVAEGPINGVVLTDGTGAVALNGITLKLQTVIDPQQNPEGKPYAPADPVTIAWPIWIWVSIAAVLFIVTMVAVQAYRRNSSRKRLLAELNRHGSALSPYHQFNKDLRSLNREYPLASPNKWTPAVAAQYMTDINRNFRWFIARQFVVPAFEWSPAAIVRELKKKDKRLHGNVEKDLRLALRELDKGIGAGEKLTALDGQQILDLCRKVADEIHRASPEVKR